VLPDVGNSMAAYETLIDASELRKHLEDERWRVVDCRFDLMHPQRGREAYLHGHIPGAVYADLNVDLAGSVHTDSGRHPLPDVHDLAATWGRLGIHSDTQVIVHDDNSGAMAARAWWLLRWLGHDRVALLDGGLRRWQALALPMETGAVTVPEEQFAPAPQNERVITTDELEAACRSATAPRLFDARDAARFRGDREPIDPVAGHIPGAKNMPFTASLNEDGTWKRPTALRHLWSSALGEDPDLPWGVMCGSGVTACHLALSAVIAGYEEPRLYAGSWSEWIRDPRRPIASAAA
jgi:thiosulfate/3-mercaptopyruvate sulfurtransferase